MARRNINYDKLDSGYLFPKISNAVNEFLKKNPGVEVMKLGIGNTTEPLTPTVIRALQREVEKLADVKTYTGYGDEQGNTKLREALAARYSKRGVSIDPQEVFVSDGAKPDSANIQSLFGQDNVIAIEDPAYPVPVDSNVIAGRTGKFVDGKYEGLVYMPCTEENGFFPAIPEGKVDLIYICSPNNPTGAVATKEQLQVFVDYARAVKAVVIFDAAYSAYISDPALPRSIYEIQRAKECAIEINSFSKDTGFTGVRLGWTVVPKELVCEDAAPGVLNFMWNRSRTTTFNGASNISQGGGIGALSEEGQRECQGLINYYMNNARIIREGLMEMGMKVFGGVYAPYSWVRTPNNMDSWAFFNKLLEETHVVCTPGSGFGPHGEGYVRFSAYGHTPDIEKAVKSIQQNLKL